MKRVEPLRPLSRDHHQVLFKSKLLREATAETASELRDDWIDFFAGEGTAHFRAEEEILVPIYLEYEPSAESLLRRVWLEHADVRRMTMLLRRHVDIAVLHDLGKLLERHVRFEERELFPAIERAVPLDVLEEVAGEVEERESQHFA